MIRIQMLIATLVAATAFAGCASINVNDGTEETGVIDVVMKNSAYSPKVLTIQAGSTVRWTNLDEMGHTITPTDKAAWGTAGSGDEVRDWLLKGGTWSFTFVKPGRYDYFCIPHAFKDDHGMYQGMVGTIIVTEGPVASEVDALVIPDSRAPPPIPPRGPAHVHYEMETVEKVAQLADGVSYEFWTFNGTVPGPMLRVRIGDTVHLTLKNAASSQHPHSIDLHAATGQGGGAAYTQVAPGESKTVVFKALNAGIYVYHCATSHIPTHVANGMYGLILVEPAEGLPPADREYFLVQGETYTKGPLGEPGRQEFSLAKLLSEDPEYFHFNGRAMALTGERALTANVNDTVRLYVGVGGFVPSSFHVIGEIFDVVYPEGSFANPMRDIQTTLIPAGGAAVVEFQVDTKADYIIVDHWLTHSIDRGAVAILRVEGPDDPTVIRAG
jgi:nitrite reductase (NO-forming)